MNRLITNEDGTKHVELRQNSGFPHQILGLKQGGTNTKSKWRFRTYGRIQHVNNDECWHRIGDGGDINLGYYLNMATCLYNESEAKAKLEEFSFQQKEIPGSSTVKLKINQN